MAYMINKTIEIKRYTKGLRWEDTPTEEITLRFFSDEELTDIAYTVVKEISEREQNEIRWNQKGFSNGHYVGSMYKF